MDTYANPEALVTTEWRYRSHAWHMAERFLVGYPINGKWHTPGLEVEVRDILATHARFDDDNVELDLVEAQRLTTAC